MKIFGAPTPERVPLRLFLFVETFCAHLTKLLVMNSRARLLLELLLNTLQTACNLLESFRSIL